jgi:hypothetical protein
MSLNSFFLSKEGILSDVTELVTGMKWSVGSKVPKCKQILRAEQCRKHRMHQETVWIEHMIICLKNDNKYLSALLHVGQGERVSSKIVALVMDMHRLGTLRSAVLYDVEDSRGEWNLKDCVADADGKVRDMQAI